MLMLKGCTRCGGDIVLDRDRFGPFFLCVQCGFLKDVSPVGSNVAYSLESAGRPLAKPLARGSATAA